MTKQEKIQECWGVHYAGDINENGYRTYDYLFGDHLLHQWDDRYFDKGITNQITTKYWVRPKSLKGIENNNGWVKIYCENDMPQFDCECYVISKVSIGIIFSRWNQVFDEYQNEKARKFWLDNFSHYKIIETQKQPLY